MGTRLRTTLRAGSWAVLVGLVALLLAAVVVPRVAGASTFTVLSASMSPALDPGSLVVVRPTDPEEIGIGSVVTFQLESGEPALVTHRVVRQGFDAKNKPVYLTEGDANDAPDQIWVRPEQIRGTVWYAIPFVGQLTAYIPDNTRRLLASSTATLLLGYGALMFVLAARDRRRLSHA